MSCILARSGINPSFTFTVHPEHGPCDPGSPCGGRAQARTEDSHRSLRRGPKMTGKDEEVVDVLRGSQPGHSVLFGPPDAGADPCSGEVGSGRGS
jgi:hypothetical protein